MAFKVSFADRAHDLGALIDAHRPADRTKLDAVLDALFQGGAKNGMREALNVAVIADGLVRVTEKRDPLGSSPWAPIAERALVALVEDERVRGEAERKMIAKDLDKGKGKKKMRRVTVGRRHGKVKDLKEQAAAVVGVKPDPLAGLPPATSC